MVKTKLSVDFLEPSNQRRYTGPCQLSESVEALSYWFPVLWHATKKCFAKKTICLLSEYLTQSTDECLSWWGRHFHAKHEEMQGTLLWLHFNQDEFIAQEQGSSVRLAALSWPDRATNSLWVISFQSNKRRRITKWEAVGLKACGGFFSPHKFLFCHNMGISQYQYRPIQLEYSLWFPDSRYDLLYRCATWTVSHSDTELTFRPTDSYRPSDDVMNTV